MDAEDKVHGKHAQNRAMLVIGGKLSKTNRQVADTLNVQVIEEVKAKWSLSKLFGL